MHCGILFDMTYLHISLLAIMPIAGTKANLFNNEGSCHSLLLYNPFFTNLYLFVPQTPTSVFCVVGYGADGEYRCGWYSWLPH